MNNIFDFKATNIKIDDSLVSGIDFTANPITIYDAESFIKDDFLNNQTVHTMDHTLIIKDMNSGKEITVDEAIKYITEDIKVDGQPIGKFPIGMIEFELTGDFTEQLDVLGDYEVRGYDEYEFDGGYKHKFNMKTYIITEIEYRHEDRATYFKGYDYGNKLSVEYDDSKYKLPLTFGQFVTQFYKNHGLELENPNDLFMKDYKLKVIPTYDSDMMALQVARDIAKFSLSLQYIDDNNKVVIKNVEDMNANSNLELDDIYTFKTFREQPNNFKSLGINTLVLGLQSDIDGENVSKSDKTMIDVDGDVELRLDDIPFVYNQELKQEVIDAMFNKIKGFKYYAFESETHHFFYNLGDQFKQIEQGHTGESYPVLVLERNLKKQGSMMTRNSAESKSTQETQMKWEEFTAQRQTEIRVDKANQEIVGLVHKTDEQDDRLSKLTIDLEGISSEVARLNPNANLIVNIAGTLDNYMYWEFENTESIRYFEGLVYKEGLRYGTNFEIVDVPNSVAKKGKSFFGKGKAITTYGYIVPDEVYSYRVRRMQGQHEIKVDVREYDKDSKLIKTTPFSLVGKEYQEITFRPAQNTMYARLAIEAVGATYTNRLVIAEDMFNRGNPKSWQESSTEVQVWAQSQIEQTNNRISSTVEEIKIVNGKVENNQSQINQMSDDIELKVEKDGVIGSINVSPEGLKISSGKLEFDNAVGNNVNLTGKITATSGKVGGYDIQQDKLVGNEITLGQKEIKIGEGSLINTTDTAIIGLKGAGLRIGEGLTGNEGWGRAIQFSLGLNNHMFFATANKEYGVSVRANTIVPNVPTARANIGASNIRYDEIFLKNQPNVSSDVRIKNNIKDIPKELINRFMELQPKQYTQNGQVHFGYIAQDVERVIYKYCADKYGWENAQVAMDKYALLHKSESHLSLLYGEIQILKDAYYKQEVTELRNELNELKQSKPKISKGFRKRRVK